MADFSWSEVCSIVGLAETMKGSRVRNIRCFLADDYEQGILLSSATL